MIVNCSHCNAEINKIPSRVSKNNYCNNSCKGSHYKTHLMGDNNPCWRGGKPRSLREGKLNKEWRLSVFERDNFTCRKCGDNRGGNLNAHHMLSWSDYEAERFITSNGITFCKSCHDTFHKKYTWHHFKEEDVLEFMEEV